MKKIYTLQNGVIVTALIFKSENENKYAEVFETNFATPEELDEFKTLIQNDVEEAIDDVRIISKPVIPEQE